MPMELFEAFPIIEPEIEIENELSEISEIEEIKITGPGREVTPEITGDRICVRHNSPYQVLTIPLTEKTLLFCSDCNSEQSLAEDEATRQREARTRQATLNAALDNAMLAPRFKQKTLENYIAKTPKQQAAVGAAKWFAEQAQKRQSAGLLLLGNTGTGKNHLAAGILNAFVQHTGGTALFTEAAKFIRAVKESWRKGSSLTESEVLSLYREPDLLIIDEVGVQFGSDTEKMYLTELINDRYSWLKSTVLIGNLSMSELTTLIGQRALDRLRENGRIVIFDWESWRISPKSETAGGN